MGNASKWRKDGIYQLNLPDPNDHDPHPRLILPDYACWGDTGIHAGDCFEALMPDGKWHDITLEITWEKEGAACWYISTPGFSDVCPVGLFVRIRR